MQGCSVGCTIGTWDIAPLVFTLAAGRSMGFPNLKNAFSTGDVLCLGAAGFRFVISHDRPYVSVRVARFHLMYSSSAEYSKKAYPSTTHDPTMRVQ